MVLYRVIGRKKGIELSYGVFATLESAYEFIVMIGKKTSRQFTIQKIQMEEYKTGVTAKKAKYYLEHREVENG